jgi:putative toxin-antitoxin system antitoxin component (TIGR02293 family)
MINAQAIAQVLGGRKALGRPIRSMTELDELVSEGIPRPALDALVSHLASPEDERTQLSLRYKIIPRATYQRSPRLNLHYSETTERLARLYAMAHAVWQDAETTRRFLMTPHPELGGKTPLDAALTEIGGRRVEEVIARGLHGLPV